MEGERIRQEDGLQSFFTIFTRLLRPNINIAAIFDRNACP